MAANPVARLVAASAACFVLVLLVSGLETIAAVLFGMLGPLAVAVGTWVAVERTHTRAPERVAGLMITLFGAKMIGIGAYVAAVLLVLSAHRVTFVVSFTCQYILLHLIEAFCLRRLFAAGGDPAGTLSVS
jgi:hypothetical protein